MISGGKLARLFRASALSKVKIRVGSNSRLGDSPSFRDVTGRANVVIKTQGSQACGRIALTVIHWLARRVWVGIKSATRSL